MWEGAIRNVAKEDFAATLRRWCEKCEKCEKFVCIVGRYVEKS
jgi:hypothetical protein